MSRVLPVTHIIPTRERQEMILGAVESILAGSAVPAELIVVDQSRVRHPAFPLSQVRDGCTVRYIWSQSVGVSRGRNAGIAAASHTIVSFTDDDILVSADWFTELIRPLLSGPARTVVTGRVLAGDSEVTDAFAPSTISHDDPWVVRGRTPRDVLYPNFAILRSAFDEIGSYDVRLGPGSRFPSAEDNDLGHRLLAAGYRIVYVPGASVVHRAWRTSSEFVPLRWAYGRGQGAFYAKHATAHDGYITRRFVRDLVSHVLRAGRHTLRGRGRRAAGDLAYGAGLIVGATQWYAFVKRRR